MKYRNIFPRTGALLLAGLFACQIQAQQIDIQPTKSTSPIYNVRSRLEGRGVVIPEDGNNLKLTVSADFEYDERIIARTSQLKSIRSYEKATAKLNVDNKPMINRLSSDNSVVIAQTKGPEAPIKLASLGGPITQIEFELINTPGNTLILAEVFRKNAVKKGDKWKPNPEVLANFLNITSVDDTDVEIELAEIKGKIATLVIAGETTGVLDGANTKLELNGSVLFDTVQGIVSKSQLTISQQRDIGLLSPGLDATFKMATVIKPVATSQNLTDEGLASLRKSKTRITNELELSPVSTQVSMLHPRDWKVITDHQGRAVLRYNKNGRMIGQCDIIPLPNRLTNQPQTLEQFKSVVKTRLEDSAAQVTGATKATTAKGLEWLRVDAIGSVSGVNLQWTYYTINNPDGRRVQLVFTTEPANARSFDGMDQYLIDSLEFDAAKAPAQNAGFKKTPAKKTK